MKHKEIVRLINSNAQQQARAEPSKDKNEGKRVVAKKGR